MTRMPGPTRGDPLLGAQLGEFVIRERLGEGGFGVVYRAAQPALDREAVIKVLHTRLRAAAVLTDRFLREAKLASKLDHPYAAHVYAFGAQPDGALWIAMELVRGTPLDEVLRVQGPIPLERLVPLLERICEVVQTAHDQGIVHRDIKPANVMVLARAGRLLPKLLDFGIAKALHPSDPALGDTVPEVDAGAAPTDLAATLVPRGDSLAPAALTQRGAVMGSPPYMAPEQWLDAANADARTDLYALAVLTYEALTGKPPFTSNSLTEIARQHATEPPPSLGPRFPAALDPVFATALAKRPSDRFPSALAFAEALRRAAGIAPEVVALPALAERVRSAALAAAPQPIAEAVAAVEAARNPHQARDAHWQLLRVIVRYLGLIALAARSRFLADDGDDTGVRDGLRELSRRGLADRAWFELGKHLTRAWKRRSDAHPIPELVELFHGPRTALEALIARRETATEPGATDDAVGELLEHVAAEMSAVLDHVAFLADYPLVVPLAVGLAERWTGVRRAQRTTMAVRGRGLEPGAPALVDRDGTPVLSLAPLFQIAAPSPGAPLELFQFDGRGRHGARLVAPPSGFEHHDDTLWDWLRAQLADSLEDGAAAPGAERPPYRGLSAFSADDSAVFFGREKQVDAVLNRLRVQPLLVVVGRSGAGKSSFVHAGVVPGLPPGYQVIAMRPGPAPRVTLAARLAAAGVALPADGPRGDLAGAVRAHATARGPVLLVVDQLEEAFTLCADPDERTAFLAAIVGAAVTADDPVRVVCTLRDDFLVRAEQVAALRNRLGQALQLLAVPAAEDLRRILIEPARRAGYEFEDPELPAEMVDEVAEQPGALALLSFAAAALWDLRDRHFRQLTRKAYRSLGGVGGALARHAEATLAAMTAEEQRLTREAFRHLVTTQNTRAVLDRTELRQLLGDAPHVDRVIERLVEARLLVASENERGAETIEVIHEALLAAWPRLVEWRREDVAGARLREQLRVAARQWDERGRNPGLLWRGDALAELTRWRAQHAGTLTSLERAFAEASVREARRGRRIRRALVATAFAVLATGVVVLTAINARTETERRRAEAAQGRAVANQRLVLEEQGRQLFLAGDVVRALVYLAAARDAGADDPALRYLEARAVDVLGRKRRTLTGHAAAVAGVSVDTAGRVLSYSDDGTARVWDATTGAVTVLAGHEGRVKMLASHGDRIATGGNDGAARVWDARTGRLVHELGGHAEDVYVLRFDRTGERLLTAGWDGAIRLWSAAGQLVATLPGKDGDVVDAVLTADARVAFAISFDHAVVRWDFATRTPTVLAPRRAGPQCLHCSVVLAPTGELVATAVDEGLIGIWSPAGRAIRTLDLRASAVAYPPVFDATATRLAVPIGNEIQIWDVASGERRMTLVGHQAEVAQVAFSADGARLVSAGGDGVRIWGTDDGLQLARVPLIDAARGVAFAPDGGTIAIAAGRAVELWDAGSDLLDRSLAIGAGVVEVGLGPGDDVLGCSEDGAFALWRAKGDPVIAGNHGATCLSGAVSPDGARIATGGADGKIRIRAATGGAELVIDTATPGVHALAFSPDGRRLLGAAGDHLAKLWDPATGAALATLSGHTDLVGSVAWSPDGARIATCGFDATARLWDAATGTGGALPVNGRCYAIAFSPDGARLLASGRNTARIWNAADPAQYVDLEGHHTDAVAAFVTNELVATTSSDRLVRIWDAATGRLLETIPHPSIPDGVKSDGRRVATFAEGRVFVWGLPPRLDPERRGPVLEGLPLELRDGLLVWRVLRE
jgi:WD40 repeat protein